VMMMYKIQQYFKKHLWLRHPLPFFVIDFAGPEWSWLTFESIGGAFISGERFVTNVKSLHFKSEKDFLFPWLKNDRNFENPIVVDYDQGHRPVRTLPKESLTVVADFFTNQFETKNGSRKENE